MTPGWLLELVAALMLVLAALSAARLVAARTRRPGSAAAATDAAHLLMAVAMAGMLTSSLTTLPDTGWEVVFALMTAWFAVRVLADARSSGIRALAGGHCAAPHLAHSAAMLYMFLALGAPAAGMSGMAGMGGGSVSMTMLRVPTLAFLFVLILTGYSVGDLDQLSGRRRGRETLRLALAGAGVPALAGAGSGPGAARPGARAAVPMVGPAPAAGTVPAAAAAVDPEVRVAAGRSAARAGEFLLSPAVTIGARVTMGIAMVFILVISI